MANILHPLQVSKLIDRWIEEDVSNFDYGGHVVGSNPQSAVILMKTNSSDVVLAGCPFVECLFEKLNCRVEFHYPEGSILPNKCPLEVARAHGPVNKLLIAERIAMNCLARSSGIATEAKRYVEKLKSHSTKVAGTRKTTPGFRLVEKYALIIGGADPHRYDLSSQVMLKDNHVWISGSVAKAVEKARQVTGFSIKIEVECRNVEQALEAATAGCDIVMLDNFSPDALHVAAKEIKLKFPYLLVEASGGICYENIDEFSGPNVDVLSTSKLTQGYPVVDYSMKVIVSGHDPSNPLVTLEEI